MRIANIEVGRPDTSPGKPSHTRGVRMGNAPETAGREPGLSQRDGTLLVGGRRSTGINPKHREPIDPRSPRLTPA
jgi:hypothetical protein